MAKQMMRQLKYSIYVRLLISLCFVFFFVVMVAGILTYSYFNKTLKQESYKFNSEILGQTKQIVELALQEVEKTALSLSLEKAVDHAVSIYNSDNPDYEVFRNVSGLLDSKVTSSNFIHSIYIYSKKSGKVIASSPATGSGIIDLRNFADKTVLDEAFRSQKTSYWTNTRTLGNVMGNYENVVSYVLTLPIAGWDREGCIVINIKESLLYSALVNINNSKLGNVALLNNEGQVLSFKDKSKLYKQLWDEEYLEDIVESPKGYFIREIAGHNMFVSYITSDYNGWKYVTLSETKEVFKSSNILIRTTILISVLCLLIGVVMSFLISGKYYTPVRSLMDVVKGRSNFSAPDAGSQGDFKDEFAYIRNSFTRLIEQNEEFEQRFRNNELVLKEHFLLNLVMGRIGDRRDIHSQIIYYGIDISMENFIVMVLKIEHDGAIGNDSEQKRNMIGYQICNIARETILRVCKGIVLGNDRSHFILLLNFEPQIIEEEALVRSKEIAFELITGVKEQFGIEATIGIGGFYKLVSESYLSYKEAMEALMFEKIAGKGSIITINDIMSANSDRKDFMGFEEKKDGIISELKLGSFERASAAAESVIDEIVRNKRISYELKNVMLMQMVNSIVMAVMDINGSMEEIFGRNCNPYYEFGRLNSLTDMKKWFVDIISRETQFIKNQRENKNRDLIDRVVQYIHQNFTEPITLQTMTEFIYMNSTYFCKIFKETTGKTFMEYLTEVRIEEACRMLRETDSSISQIAEASGFGDKQNIARAFKKYLSVTPTDYRNAVVREKLESS